MRARETFLIWIPAGLILLTLTLSFLLGFIRNPIDEGYMLQIDSRSRVAGERWGTMQPISGNYWLGSWGRAFQIREGNEVYQITVNRYLNILPDVIHDAKPVGGKIIFHK